MEKLAENKKLQAVGLWYINVRQTIVKHRVK